MRALFFIAILFPLALKARDTGDKTAQGWINQALNAAGGDWKRAEKEYNKLHMNQYFI